MDFSSCSVRHDLLDSYQSLMKDVTIVIPSRGENPKYAKYIKANADCKVIVIRDRNYGEAIKKGIRQAQTELVLTMDADGQHTLYEARRLYQAYKLAGCDLMIGDRRLQKREKLRSLASTCINLLASAFAHRWVVDLNGGLRIFRKDLAVAYEPILCDDFSYTTTLTMAHLADNYSVEWFPIRVFPRPEGKSKAANISNGLRTIYYVVRTGTAFRTRGLRKSLRKLMGKP